MVYVNKILEKKDEEDFQDLWTLIPNGDRVELHTDLSFSVGPN